MLAYTVVGTNDLEKSAAFYDSLLAEIGAKRVMDLGRLILWGVEGGMPFFCVSQPYDGHPATVGNGSMVAFAAKNSEEVDRLHAKALQLGASNEGEPGPRTLESLHCYAGYFRDLDHNKLNFFCMI